MENNNNIPRRKGLKLGFGLAAGTMGSAFAISKVSEIKIIACLHHARNWGHFLSTL
jgi:hypothetical protein